MEELEMKKALDDLFEFEYKKNLKEYLDYKKELLTNGTAEISKDNWFIMLEQD